MPSPIRVAVLSFWHVHAGDYTRRTVEHPDTELVAIWDDDDERGKAAAEQYGVEHTADLEALLARDDIDAVTVTTETSRHRDIMVAAARAGKHIFTEKLLAPTVAEAEEIIKACDDNGVKLIVSLPRLYDGYTPVIKELIESGKLGDITYGRVRLSHNGSVANWLPDRFYDPEPAIGGALTDLGCHPVYLTQLFLGSTPSTVSATYGSVTGRAVEDNAVVTVGYPSGAIGVIEAGFASPSPFIIDIGGTEGVLTFNDRDGVVVVRGAAFGDDAQQLPIAEKAPSAYEQWVTHIQQDTRADANLAAAVELTRLVVAANESAHTGRTISYSKD
ncbi:Gfo/Idh/MocA family protein [Microlunatus sp. Gsoil 973]|uniref:Gfo/Idh/MocA family protein n=1 Tax=Microlunatus sp. Gsoil 973 TaxID=2672569 RepID=UPI0012B44AED|nr:Gfo/Idh/MocA family oxidoreductase [Microlunatus sp. Gsoil 973]QGN34860.1 gfo/Idh/MocA family oxidoreductase [Microlunatus sp. Gsoil 973]